MVCLCTGAPFDATFKNWGGYNVLIASELGEEELIVRCMETHDSFRMRTMLVNEHRREEGKYRVSESVVVDVFYHLQPKINIINKVQSGDLNKQRMAVTNMWN